MAGGLADRRAEEAPASARRGARTLLLVSRDSALQRALRAVMVRHSIPLDSLVTVGNERQALDVLATHRCCLAIVDDDLDATTGPDLLIALQRAGLKTTCVIYVAHRHTLDLEGIVRRVGVLYYTGKPLQVACLELIAARITGLQSRRASPRSDRVTALKPTTA